MVPSQTNPPTSLSRTPLARLTNSKTLTEVQASLLVLPPVLALEHWPLDRAVSMRLLVSILVLTPAEVWSRRAPSLLTALPILLLSISRTALIVALVSLPVPLLALVLAP